MDTLNEDKIEVAFLQPLPLDLEHRVQSEKNEDKENSSSKPGLTESSIYAPLLR